MIFKPCLDCGKVAKNSSRCSDCVKVVNKIKNSSKPRSASRALRAKLNRSNEPKICNSCSIYIDYFEVDHIIPLAENGLDIEENLQILCRPCHLAKNITKVG